MSNIDGIELPNTNDFPQDTETFEPRALGSEIEGLQRFEMQDANKNTISVYCPKEFNVSQVTRIWAATYPTEYKYTAGMLRKKEPRQILEKRDRGVDMFTPKPPLKWHEKARKRLSKILRVLARKIEAGIAD